MKSSVISEINDANYSFIPIAVGPHGEIGSTFRQFWDGSDPLPIPNFDAKRPQARRAAIRATSSHTPWDVLGTADRRWKADRGGLCDANCVRYMVLYLPWVGTTTNNCKKYTKVKTKEVSNFLSKASEQVCVQSSTADFSVMCEDESTPNQEPGMRLWFQDHPVQLTPIS
eukprot:scaffold248506_cov113-Cyclotella_meneghiniana.AAC.1